MMAIALRFPGQDASRVSGYRVISASLLADFSLKMAETLNIGTPGDYHVTLD